MHADNGREVRTLWGYLAWRLGGWEAVDSISDSEATGTNPGSEQLIPIPREAAPCLVLMDEVVAFARQLGSGGGEGVHPRFVPECTVVRAAAGALSRKSCRSRGIDPVSCARAGLY